MIHYSIIYIQHEVHYIIYTCSTVELLKRQYDPLLRQHCIPCNTFKVTNHYQTQVPKGITLLSLISCDQYILYTVTSPKTTALVLTFPPNTAAHF